MGEIMDGIRSTFLTVMVGFIVPCIQTLCVGEQRWCVQAESCVHIDVACNACVKSDMWKEEDKIIL
jgi:hypothetical protein